MPLPKRMTHDAILHNFQRIGAKSNAAAGKEFEGYAQQFFAAKGILLKPDFSVPVGIHGKQKSHSFDLGSESPAVLVECKSHTWTAGNKTPSAKMTVWNEAMYYFHSAPSHYRKILFVLKHRHEKRGLTLADHYIRTHAHFIPGDVEIWEFEASTAAAEKIFG